MFLYDVSAYQNSDNLYKVYLTIKDKVNKILIKYDDISYLGDPSIDIDAITKEYGIVEIVPVPPEEINFEHAVLDDRDKSRIVIKVNNTDSKEEQLFSAAHELEHFFKKNADMLKKADIFRHTEFEKKANVLKDADSFTKSNKLSNLAARTGGNYKKVVKIIKRVNGTKPVAKYIAETVSKNIGKKVSVDKAYVELAKMLVSEDDTIKKKNENFLTGIINRLYDEEIADYFAANLLVPTERFIFWEDKSDKEIAKAFKVSKACIQKRRKEVKHEVEFTKTRVYLSNSKN